jgi:Family of unknown function (DUF5683)
MPARACRVIGRTDTLGNGWALVDLGDFKSLSRARPSEVGSIPTHSRHPLRARALRGTRPHGPCQPSERLVSLSSTIVAGLTFIAWLGAAAPSRGAVAEADTTRPAGADSAAIAAPDTSRTPPSDSLRTITVKDSLGIPGTLRGQTVEPDPAAIKGTLQRMGSNEIAGRTQWERQKNPKVAMLCSALLPGLGQTYNGRRLKVGLMVGFASFYSFNGWLNWKRYEAAIVKRDAADPGSGDFRVQNELADFYKEEARTHLWWFGATWVLGILDSWIDAHLYDVRGYTPPAPPESAIPHAVDERTSYLTLGFDLEFSK